MVTLFRTGDGEVTDTIIVALELVDNDWFKRNLIGALELMCHEENWAQAGTATVGFARDKANEMLEGILLDVIIPTLPIGTMAMWPGATIPARWLYCNGQSLLRASYPDLFTILGTTYGAVDGTHFNVPDFRDRSPIGVGTVFAARGTPVGNFQHNIDVSELPAHHHVQHIGNNVAMRAFVAGGSGTLTPAGAATSSITDMVTADTGGGVAINLVHPSLTTLFIIYAGV